MHGAIRNFFIKHKTTVTNRAFFVRRETSIGYIVSFSRRLYINASWNEKTLLKLPI